MSTENKLQGVKYPEFPYHQEIFELYIQDSSNPMWNKYTKLQEWISQVNDYVIQQYRHQFALEKARNGNGGETFYNMLAGKLTIS